ncbi:TY3B-TY3B protein [Mycena venus]|uniref:TY3B-TY3B protein n=1 Tax=Mycena venus TaxID=2733690 RepID=A0A8H6YWG2_9AGAR|nr:TY3B-TY3B protein [Mycena venus]
MPFGYRNGPSVFQRVMQTVLAPFLWLFALVYIDDIVIFSLTFDDHLKHLDLVFSAIATANITLSPPKCHLGYQSLLLLGQKVSRLGLSTHKEKVDAILQLDEPRNAHELQHFLGSHKRSYACEYGLAGILQQIQPVRIQDLRGTRLYERLERAHKNGEDIPTLVTVIKGIDDVPVPGSWAENFEDTVVHIERVICYWSRVLKSPERNYSPTEREALALKEALIKFQPFLEGEIVAGITDHAALTWSRTFQNVNRRLLTWGTIFSAYPGLKIVHRAGRVHSNVDPISRLRRRVPLQDSPNAEHIPMLNLAEGDPLKNMYDDLGPRLEEKLLTMATRFVRAEPESGHEDTVTLSDIPLDHDEVLTSLYTTVRAYAVVIGISSDEIREWTAAYREDPHFVKVLDGWKSEKDWSNPLYPQYHYSENGLIFFEDWQGLNRLCVPSKYRASVMSEIHDTPSEAAHAGYHRCYNRLAATYYWPKMSRDLKKKSKPRRHAGMGLLQPIPIPSRPFEVVSFDFIPELPDSDGFDNILVIVDKLTKYGIFIPCSTKISELETAQLFFKHVVTHFGLTRQVISDRDTRWRNDFWAEICRLMGMKRALTTAYHPQADGQTEILNQTLEIALRAYVGPARDDWSKHLDALALSYNTTPHSSSGFSPAYLLYGYHPVTGASLMAPGAAIGRPVDETGGGVNW